VAGIVCQIVATRCGYLQATLRLFAASCHFVARSHSLLALSSFLLSLSRCYSLLLPAHVASTRHGPKVRTATAAADACLTDPIHAATAATDACLTDPVHAATASCLPMSLQHDMGLW
jgi:hypothetical protein